MQMEATDRRIAARDLLEVAQTHGAFTSDAAAGLDPYAQDFLSQIAQEATEDDVIGLTDEDLVALAAGFWRWTGQKRADAQDIRMIAGKGAGGRALDRDVLEICGPDMPFLVDSVMGEIGAQGVEVRAMFHPILHVCRDGDGVRRAGQKPLVESLIQIHLPKIAPSKRDAILMGVRETLTDVRMAVADFHAMRDRMSQAIADLSSAQNTSSIADVEESVAFLNWLQDDHFVFLGARSYDYSRDNKGALANDEPIIREDLNLGILRDPLRMVLRRINEPSVLTAAVRAYIEEPAPIIVAKSNLRSRVHRRGVLDYIGVKRYGASGEVLGEDRFIGLFTAEAYDRMVRDVPLLRRKVARAIAGAGFVAGSHNDKRFRNIVENYPRDELFQIDDGDLLRIALGVQHLMDRPRSKIFVRCDRFDRFFSVMVFVPRDRYNSDVREKIGAALAEAFAGRLSAYYPAFGDAPLARVHYIIGVTPGQHGAPDLAALEARIADITKTWQDELESLGEREGQSQRLIPYLGGFPAGYRERFDAREALADCMELDAIEGERVRVRAYRLDGEPENVLRAKLYKAGAATDLSAALPILESMGLYVNSETPFLIARTVEGASSHIWIQDLTMRTADEQSLDFSVVEASFEQAFAAIWAGQTETDGFNRLILKLGISWREAALVRALARWRSQTGLDPSEAVQCQAVGDYPEITRALLDLFKARFDPDFGSKKQREAAVKDIQAKINQLLDTVPSLDADRVLRRLLGLLLSMVRTNFYQRAADGGHKAYMSFKIATRDIVDVPAPKPYREIWVWSPLVEGAHLRFGPVARGGLRWSDRRDDFRTEVLGLVKAQQVKNAVIVPVGSKGAFFPKALPRAGTRDEIQAAAIEAYTIFLKGLLDITDNLDGAGAIIPPSDVVRWDGDDPYLVVAADKGTATFSDIANGISAEYGHWLGDAFASGGSVGYDHKKMGITAKGAWEAVKRHFREMGHDIQSEPFSVIGVGDMSGDVFGNGMLLSPHIKLVAAFDHRDIFIDPEPDTARSFAERARLLALPRSSWADYDQDLISQGGGVFSRSAKSIPLTAQMRALTGLEGETATPTDMMQALLKSPCDLLWFGGIGTYVKASGETHADAGDKANDLIRVNGADLACKVIGEGANLGLTQRGRIEAAQKGVRLNTDAIDNSAGVDSSDHEVNIKILLNGLVRAGAMDGPARDTLLASMTDDVARHVLAHNYAQTLAISLQEATAPADLDAHARLIGHLESAGRLDRRLEFLPDMAGFAARRTSGQGLTRPELSVLTAYCKLSLFDELIASDAPDDPWFERVLVDYFPDGCRAYSAAMAKHRLRREIIATVLSNQMIDLCGTLFIDRVREGARLGAGDIAKAFAATRAIFGLGELIAAIHACDIKPVSQAQHTALQAIGDLLVHQGARLSRPFLGRSEAPSVADLVARYRPAVTRINENIYETLAPDQKQASLVDAKALEQKGLPLALAKQIAALPHLHFATDIADIAASKLMEVDQVARLYHGIGARVGLDEVRAAARDMSAREHWDRVAIARLQGDLMGAHSALTASVCDYARGRDTGMSQTSDAKGIKALMDDWSGAHSVAVANARNIINDLATSSGGWTFPKLSIANTQLAELVQSARSE